MAGGRYKGQIHRDVIQRTLLSNQGNVSKSASELGVRRETFRDWLNHDDILRTYLTGLKNANPSWGGVKKVERKKPVPLDLAKPESSLKLAQNDLDKKRIVVTCCQNNTELHKPFLKTLLHYCKVNDAQLIVIPIRYKNVTAYVSGEDYTVQWPSELKEYYLNDEFSVNENLVILGDLKIQATALQPLVGINNVAKSKSAVIGHPQIALKMVPTPLQELPRQLVTTGSCSMKNYSESKAGHRASFHHTLGALVIEVDGDVFYTRHILPSSDGSFYDLDTKYYIEKHLTSWTVKTEESRVLGLVCGDGHNDYMDPGVKQATWLNPDSIVKVCKPQHQFLQDSYDCYSSNHHHVGNTFVTFAKQMSGLNSVENELERLVETHNSIWNDIDTFYHYISSNHDDGLTRWLNEADPKKDPVNALFYHKLMIFMLENTYMTPNGTKIPNPLKFYLQSRIKNPDSTFFHSRDERVSLAGIDLSQHGDRGPNGKRGTISQFSQTGYKCVIGHSHTPGIEKGAYQVGTSSRLKLEYNSGYSSWMHTHCLIYPNGKRTLINIINGKWRI